MTTPERRWLVRGVSLFFLLATLAASVAWLAIGPGGLRGNALYFHAVVAAPFVIGWVAFTWLPSFAPMPSPRSRRLHGGIGLAGLITTVLAALAMSSGFGTEPVRTLIATHAWAGVITLVGLVAFTATAWSRRSSSRD